MGMLQKYKRQFHTRGVLVWKALLSFNYNILFLSSSLWSQVRKMM